MMDYENQERSQKYVTMKIWSYTAHIDYLDYTNQVADVTGVVNWYRFMR